MPAPSLPGRDAGAAVARYEAIRHRLPKAVFPASSRSVADLGDLADDIDLFILDAYGVINVGEQAIPGSAESVNALSRAGKHVIVLTNGASSRALEAHSKYVSMGFELEPWQVVSSRQVAATAFAERARDEHWALIDRRMPPEGEFPVRFSLVGDDASAYRDTDGVLFLSTGIWTFERQRILLDAMAERARPIWCGNPDLVAPLENAFSLEPGHFVHEVADRTGIEARFFGKPFGNAFDGVFARLAEHGVALPDPQRIAMVGDSPHTDILGGAAAGVRTVLVTGHGLLRDLDVEHTLAETGIRPDFIAATT